MKKFSSLILIPGITLGLAGVANAATTEFSGFADLTYVLSDGISDGTSSTEGKFDVAAELDIETTVDPSISARIDLDFNTSTSSTAGEDSGRIEQAFFDWKSKNEIVVKGGVFNNPLGWEAEDAPDLYQVSHGQIYNLWNATTDFYGNNVAGVLVSGTVGPIVLSGGFLNDLAGTPEEQSLMGIVNFTPQNLKGFDFELGFVTQDVGLETIIDFNMTFEKAMLLLGGELFLASEVVDYGFGVTGVYKITDQISITGRFDSVSYDIPGFGTATAFTFAGSYMVAKNLVVNAEIRINDSDFTPGNTPGTGPGNTPPDLNCNVVACDGDIIQLEAIATF